MDEQLAVVTRVEDRAREGWDDPRQGTVTWFTLLSGDVTPTSKLSAGIAEFPPFGGFLAPHRHAQPEVYFITQGTGILTLDGRDTVVSAGATIFIPGNVIHGIRNESNEILKLFYVFPTDRFADVVYRFAE